MKTEEGRRNRYHSINFDKLFCREVSFSGPKWTPSREENKRFKFTCQLGFISVDLGKYICIGLGVDGYKM